MFGSLKAEKTKSLEILEKNHATFKEGIKPFAYSLNPHLINHFLYEVSAFAYSCQGLKNYFSTDMSKYEHTLQLESVIFVAKLSNNLLSNVQYEHYYYSDYINYVFRKAYGGDIKYYHIKLIEMIIDHQILPEIYDSDNPKVLINQFNNRAKKITKDNEWNQIIDSIIENEFSKLVEFFESNEGKIIQICNAKIYDEFDHYNNNFVKDYLNKTDYNYKPDIFLPAILSGVSDVIDSYLLDKIGMKLSDIDYGYYRKKVKHLNTYDNPILNIFREKIEEAQTFKDGEYQSSKLHLKNQVIRISGVEVGNYLNELAFDSEMKKYLKYFL